VLYAGEERAVNGEDASMKCCAKSGGCAVVETA
jgi:hypothetical protein